MKKLVLGMVFCGFAALTVGCGGEEPKKTTTPAKVDPPKTDVKKS